MSNKEHETIEVKVNDHIIELPKYPLKDNDRLVQIEGKWYVAHYPKKGEK